jgi:hypothetical protein
LKKKNVRPNPNHAANHKERERSARQPLAKRVRPDGQQCVATASRQKLASVPPNILADCVAQTTEVANSSVVKKEASMRAMIEEGTAWLQGLSPQPNGRLGNSQLVLARVFAEQEGQVQPPNQFEMRFENSPQGVKSLHGPAAARKSA